MRLGRCKRYVDLVDLVKSFPTSIHLQDLASIQPRTSPLKFACVRHHAPAGTDSPQCRNIPRRSWVGLARRYFADSLRYDAKHYTYNSAFETVQKRVDILFSFFYDLVLIR